MRNKAKNPPKMTENEVESSRPVVAKVNKSPAATKTRQQIASTGKVTTRKGASASQKKRQADNIIFDEIDAPKKTRSTAKATANVGKGQQVRKGRTGSAAGATIAQFAEGEQLIQKEVNASEDDFLTEKSEDEQSESEMFIDDPPKQEVSFLGSQTQQQAEYDSDTTMQDNPAPPDMVSAAAKSPVKNTRERLEDIDRDMAIKLHQLQEMMVQGGMTESVEVLSNCIKLTEKPSRRGSKGRLVNPANVNQNATVNNGRLNNLVNAQPSEETI